MTCKNHLILGLLFFLNSIAPAFGANKTSEKSPELSLWTRKVGTYRNNPQAPKLALKKIAFKSNTLQTIEKFDIQYEKKLKFSGLPLIDIISQYNRPPGQNLAILHFANNMIIPIPLEENFATLSSIDAFVATNIINAKNVPENFPEIIRNHEEIKDPRPLQFKKIKLIVSESWHPLLVSHNDKDKKNFSPWKQVDELIGIEFANETKYYAQFMLKTKNPIDNAGFEVFKSRCQYCHAIQEVGSKFGWDFLEPLPIFDRRKPEHLQHLVKQSYHDAFVRGLIMPTQKDVKLGEMEDLSKWLKKVQTQGVMEYK